MLGSDGIAPDVTQISQPRDVDERWRGVLGEERRGAGEVGGDLPSH
jgi:hypothetical protein